ncbi:MAG: four helix bundle protein [Candidatus Roizmanbacteria bacterium]|nr:MAG: four helix bundle protein [Candidatus Roizmanbacteria bacterium]
MIHDSGFMNIMNNTNNLPTTTKIREFTDLKAWQESHKLVILIYKVTRDFPENEKYSLVDQMRRSCQLQVILLKDLDDKPIKIRFIFTIKHKDL